MISAENFIQDTGKKNIYKLFSALGTVNSIFIPGCAETAAADRAAARIRQIQSLMSLFEPQSEVFKINSRSGEGFIRVGNDTIGLIKKAKRFSQITNGAFDITVGPLSSLWRAAIKRERLPCRDEIDAAAGLCGHNNIHIDGHFIALGKKGSSVDLGGIAKGYAADEVIRILKTGGIREALVNLGGNVAALGGPWTIGIQDPFRKTGHYLGTVELFDETAVTSGSNERYFEKGGRRYHHIIDTRTGYPANTGLASVTAIGDCSADMDALSTAAFVLGAEEGSGLLKKYGAEGVFVLDDRSVYVTQGLRKRFRFARRSGTKERL